MNQKNLYCFVCDIAVANRYFSLATCRTQSSKKKLVEKLGHLVGEKYMVVITEDDVICRSCANLMNTLDRLEVEMASVRRVVLRFLERKYELDDGALLNQCSTQETVANQSDKTSSNFMLRKKKSEQELDAMNENNTENPKSRIWMQCNKCQYTTNYKSFVNNHIRKPVCLNCEAPMQNSQCSQNCSATALSNDETIDTGTQLVTSVMDPLKMSEINGLEQLTQIAETDNLSDDVNELTMVDKNELIGGIIGEDEEENENAQMYFQVVDSDNNDGGVKQVFTVAGDGSVEMMEVLWNEQEDSVDEIPFTENNV